jgi:dihydrofolate synthase/folylpolyglutamate synthase
VTNIGWDHMEYLGRTLSAIAAEKAGIFKPGRPAVIGETGSETATIMRSIALERGADPVVVVPELMRIAKIDVAAQGTAVTIEFAGERATLETPLTGRHQAFNLAFTLGLLHAAGPPYAMSLAEAAPLLRNVRLPGRFQRVGKYIFDVAHNADGARVLADTLRAVRPPGPVRALFCALKDKEWKDMITTLSPRVDEFVLADAPTAPASRAWNLAEAREFLRHAGIKGDVAWTFDEALKQVEDAGTVVVTGSFHTVGDAMAKLQVSPLAL